MKKINKLFIILVVFSLLLITISVTNYKTTLSSKDKLAINYVALEQNDDVNTIYTIEYQNKINNQLNQLIKTNNYTIDKPLLVSNPYGTNTTSIYMYFETNELAKATYTIQCEGYSDYTNTLNNNSLSGYNTKHEYLLIGSIPNKTNYITVTIYDINNKVIDNISWTYDAPKLKGGNQYLTVSKEKDDTNQLTNGLYTVLGNDVTEESEELAYMRLYDNNGIIRSEIPIISYRSHRILFKDNNMYFSISSTKIVEMKQSGYVSEIYDTGNYKLHHDYIFDSEDNLLVLASKKNAYTTEDKIIMIDSNTKEVSLLVDLVDLFPNYYISTTLPKGKENLDWMHVNSLELINNTSLIISSRETSTIIKLNDIYTNPSVDYLIGSNNFWSESKYDNLLLNKTTDFSLQAGQHCVTYVEDNNLPENQYYLLLYNNNLATSTTRNYNWQEDSNYYNCFFNMKEGTSYYYKYLIDENNRTVSLVDSLPVSYSGYVSSVQQLNSNLIVDSGIAISWAEYDSNGNLLQRYTTTGGKFVYRVFKYDYIDYWFQ